LSLLFPYTTLFRSYVTLWLLSTDNLKRDPEELALLSEIIADVVDDLAEPQHPWTLRIVGALEVLPEEFAERLAAAADRTQNRGGMAVNVAVGYGGRQESADAGRQGPLHHARE